MVLKTCCGSFSLKNGIFIIAVLTVVGYFSSLINRLHEAKGVVDPEAIVLKIDSSILIILHGIFFAIAVFVNILMIVGINLNKAALIFPWLGFTLLSIIVFIIVALLEIVNDFVINGSLLLIIALANTYFWVVVWNFIYTLEWTTC